MQRRTFIEAENSMELRRRSVSNNNDENVFYSMAGKMSAAAKLGCHKYENHE